MLEGFVDGSTGNGGTSNGPSDAAELEMLLKHGAFHAIQGADDDVSKAFCDADIETILSSRVQRVSGPSGL